MHRLVQLLCIAALLVAPNSVGAQTIGAPVYLSQPGTVSSTLLAAPVSPSYLWSTSIWYWGGTTLSDSSVTALSLNTSAVGSTVTSAASIPSQGSLPLVFTLGYVMKSDLPTDGSQPANIPNYFVTTGFGSANNVPTGAQPSASVLFGANNTAQIGFAPIGTAVASFADYPIRIAVTNVFGSGGGAGSLPEPQTWIFTLAGLVAACLLRRRKR
jgi:MYXO-CTERM domain-containing protein